jgi:hypothetical protein
MPAFENLSDACPRKRRSGNALFDDAVITTRVVLINSRVKFGGRSGLNCSTSKSKV